MSGLPCLTSSYLVSCKVILAIILPIDNSSALLSTELYSFVILVSKYTMNPQDGKSKTCNKLSWFVLLIFKSYSS